MMTVDGINNIFIVYILYFDTRENASVGLYFSNDKIYHHRQGNSIVNLLWLLFNFSKFSLLHICDINWNLVI